MASRRRGWNELTPKYRARLERSGLTAESYASGTTLKAARGHSVTPERLTGYRGRARELGIYYIAPEYADAEPDEQIQLARDFVLGYMTRGKTTQARAIARLDFNTWLFEVRGGQFSREDWRAYRALYNQHFGGKTA